MKVSSGPSGPSGPRGRGPDCDSLFWRNPAVKIHQNPVQNTRKRCKSRHDLYCHYPTRKARQIADLCIISYNFVRNLVEQLGSIFKLFLFFYGILYP